ncbi:MAG: ChaN family lipoprotein [Myxococcales bacterium]|nr:ChaN family lipoprotein [Myxococcales bacterium]
MHRCAPTLVLAVFACAAPPPAPPPGPPVPPRVYAVTGSRALVERELVGELASARFVVLGETHDNPEHHRLQARLLERLVLAGRKPAVAFEMLRVDQQDVLDEALAGSDVSTEELRAAVAWDESGWPPFALYAPVFEAALSAELPIVGADLSQADRAALRAADPDLMAELGLGEPLPPDEQRALERDIEASHCGHATAAMLPGMVRVQRARDARLAQALLAAGGGEGRLAVLISGAEHARLDRGVPRALSRLAPGADVASVAFLELPRPANAAGDALAEADWSALEDRYSGPPPFDFVWLTEPEPREDPCVEFEEALRRMGR